jgi:hypothetical protein
MSAVSARLDPLLKAARAALAAGAADAAWRDGLQMTMTGAVEYALSNELTALSSP